MGNRYQGWGPAKIRRDRIRRAKPWLWVAAVLVGGVVVGYVWHLADQWWSSGDPLDPDTIGIVKLLVLYLFPSIVAWGRDHHNAFAISALNLALGWTILGWIAALVWSLTAVRRPDS